MKRSARENSWQRLGFRAILVLLALAVLVLAVLLASPMFKSLAGRAEAAGCRDSVAALQHSLDVARAADILTEQKAREILKASNAVCPAGGELRLEQTDEGWTVSCGIHDEDTAHRGRMNGGAAGKQVQDLVKADRAAGTDLPDREEIVLNGQTITALRTEEKVTTHRGTKAITGLDGIVIYYILDDQGVSYLAYLDEDHCAEWDKTSGWKVW